jgi:hypothetical protein
LLLLASFLLIAAILLRVVLLLIVLPRKHRRAGKRAHRDGNCENPTDTHHSSLHEEVHVRDQFSIQIA